VPIKRKIRHDCRDRRSRCRHALRAQKTPLTMKRFDRGRNRAADREESARCASRAIDSNRAYKAAGIKKLREEGERSEVAPPVIKEIHKKSVADSIMG